MKSIKNLYSYPNSSPLLSDDIVEFHAARILLLLKNCGKHGKINGLTKMAKLDFFIRYPSFFEQICNYLDVSVNTTFDTVDSRMVRHHYGPWDHRYYHVLAFLSSRSLITVMKKSKSFELRLTKQGREISNTLASSEEFASLQAHMLNVAGVLGGFTGNKLKKLIYSVFQEDIADLSLKEIIEG